MTRPRGGRSRRLAAGAGAAVGAAAILAAVGLSGGSATASPAQGSVTAAALQAYVGEIEAIRLPVNQLLGTADPILDAFHDKAITGAVASARMTALEEHFAGYLVQMYNVAPANPTLARINAPYAHVYFEGDNYLSVLADDLNDGDFDNLPNTANQERLGLIEWRTELQSLAGKAGVKLPADIQNAGRGEIVPSPDGS
jgi:hypothetical protein